jgi:hypothetical protein
MSPPAAERREEAPGVLAPQEPQARLDELHQVLGPLPRADLPIALLPVRLETRFVPAGTQVDFCVRIYPDDLHVETHEPELLDTELIHGRHAWEQIWRASEDEARRKAAWAQLAQRFGPRRAAWILRATRPANPQDRPAVTVADEQPLPSSPRFTEVPLHDEAWTRAPAVRTLPNRWVVFGYREGQRALVTWGEQIPLELAAGPSPAGPEQDVPDDQLPLDSGMRWLVDFEEAVRVGMGMRIRLAPAEAARGYDDLLVVGVKSSQDGAAGALRLAALLDSQHYTDGLAFVPQGTPTNNTPDAPSGFRSRDAGFEESYGAEIAGAAAGDRLDNANVSARALGIPGAVLSQIVGARDREQADARAMHTALWPATWGYFLEQVLDETHPVEHVSVIRRLFIDHVRGRGPVPAVRIGRQPYGILPASSLDKWKTDEGDPARAALVTLLRALRERWRTALARVPRIGRTDKADRVEADLLELLAMEPVSSGFQGRPVVDALLFGTPALPPLGSALPADIAQRRQGVQAALSALGVTWPTRVLDFVFLSHAPPLTSSLVQAGTVDARATLAPDYVRWLTETGFAGIRDEDYPPGFAPSGKKLDSLLFLLLRHSAVVAFASVAHRILRSDNVITATRMPEPSIIGVLDPNGPRPLDVLEKAPSVGKAPIGDRIHSLTATDHPAATELDEFRAALTHLSGRTVAELERLLPEALDCCAHRLDAWITGLCADRLARMRDAQSQGVLIGGYGWVQHVRPDTTRTSVKAPPGEAGRLMRDVESGGFIHAPSLNQAATAAVLRSGYLANRTSGPDQPFAIDLSSERIRRARWLLDGVRQGQPLTALLGYRFERGLHENHPGLVLDFLIDAFRKLAPLSEVYKARAEKHNALQAAGEFEKEAGAKEAKGNADVSLADQRLRQLQASKVKLTNDLKAAQGDVARFEEEIRKLQRTPGGGFPQPDPDKEARLAALRKALAAAQARVSSVEKQLKPLDPQISAAASSLTDAQRQQRRLVAEANVLRTQAKSERERAEAADRREQDLLARRRELLLLPLAAGTPTMESIAVQDVVDGLTLHRKYRKALEGVPNPRWDHDTIPFGTPEEPSELGLPLVDSDEFRAVLAELAILDSSIDAVSDAVTAESVHQAMLGNPMRAGATLNAVAGGETPPPELEAIRTPRTGTAVTYRMAAVLPEPAAGATWPTDDLQARALVEPRLNAWAALLLGDPRRVRGLAEYLVGGAIAGSREFSLDTLALSPLDLLWMAGSDPRAGAAGVLEERLRYELLRSRPDGVPADAVVRLNLGRADAWGTEILSVNEVMIVARTVSALISSSRTMDPRDLEPPESAGAADIDVHDLGARVDRLVAAFEAAHARLETLLNSPTPSAEQLRKRLLPLTYFDVDAVPVKAQGGSTTDRQALFDQAIAVHDETAKRAARLRQAIAGVDRLQLAPADRLELENARVAIVLGKTFRVVPRFRARNAAELNPSLAAADALLGGDRLAPLTWIQRMARVRIGVARLSEVVTYSQSINPGVEPDLRVLQLPHETSDRWAALPFVAGRKPPRATLSVVLQVPHGFPQSLSPDIAGLMIDEWVEVTPSASEQSGLAFHFDAPGSRPPQAILLAVPPDKQPNWDIETLETIVTETLELAKLRMVTSADLDDRVSQFLPALFFGLNLANDTVSTDFRRAAAVPEP